MVIVVSSLRTFKHTHRWLPPPHHLVASSTRARPFYNGQVSNRIHSQLKITSFHLIEYSLWKLENILRSSELSHTVTFCREFIMTLTSLGGVRRHDQPVSWSSKKQELGLSLPSPTDSRRTRQTFNLGEG